MALNIGTVNFNLDANTKGLQRATQMLEGFRKTVNDVVRTTSTYSAAQQRAFINQESASKRAFQQTLALQNQVRLHVKDEQLRSAMLAKSSQAFSILSKEMTSGLLKQHEYTRSVDAFAARMNRVRRELDGVKKTGLEKSLGNIAKWFRELESSAVLALGPLSGIGARFRALSALLNRTGAIMTTVVIGGIIGIGTALYKLGAAAVRTSMQLEQIEARFKAITGTAEGARRELDFVRLAADKLGLKFFDLGNAYSRLNAAAAGTALQGDHVRNIFVGVSEAAAALRLDSLSVEGAFRAIEQMMSKGTVQAEELRGQLGERLPGAFQMAAKAMGVSTRELDRMLRRGEIAATDLLPKIARVMHETYGPAAQENVTSLQGRLNTLSNTWMDFKNAFGGATHATDLFGWAVDAANNSLRFMSDNIVPALKGGLSGILTIFYGWGLIWRALRMGATQLFATVIEGMASAIEGAVKLKEFFADIFTVDKSEVAAKLEWLRTLQGKWGQGTPQWQRLQEDIERTEELYGRLEDTVERGSTAPPAIVTKLREMGQVLRDDLEGYIDNFQNAAGEDNPFVLWMKDFQRVMERGSPDLWKDLDDINDQTVSDKFDTLIDKIKDTIEETAHLQHLMDTFSGSQDFYMVDALMKANEELRKLTAYDLEELAADLGVDNNLEAIRQALARIFAEQERVNDSATRYRRQVERMPETAREVADEFNRITSSTYFTRLGPKLREHGELMAEISRKAETMRDKLESGTTFNTEQIDAIINKYRELLEQQNAAEVAAARFADLSQDFAERIGEAFTDAIFEGKKLSDVFKELIKDLIEMAFRKAVLGPLVDAMSGMFGNFMGGAGMKGVFKNIWNTGSAFAPTNNPVPGAKYASGGIASRPTFGMFGEAGPEAILPLGRDSSGELGVRVSGQSGGQAPIYVKQEFHFDVGLETVEQRIAAAAPVIAASSQSGLMKALRRPKIA